LGCTANITANIGIIFIRFCLLSILDPIYVFELISLYIFRVKIAIKNPKPKSKTPPRRRRSTTYDLEVMHREVKRAERTN
jgi:hypothetical protein